MKEIWKDITGFENKYQVSNLGQVRSVPHITKGPHNEQRFVNGKIIKQFISKCGYLRVGLTIKNHCSKTVLVHRLVALAFLDNPNNYPCVNHKDENKQNNHVNNLEWCTYSYNLNYHEGQKRRSEKHKNKIEMIDKYSGQVLRTFDSITDASKITGISRGGITDVCMQRHNKYTAGGYIWRYADENLRKKKKLSNDIRKLEKYPNRKTQKHLS